MSQTDWTLKKDKDGIQVYTGKVADSKFKVIKVSCVLDARLSQLAAIILQPELQPEWVIATKLAYTVKHIDASHLYYYAEASVPWPMSNRDMVIDLALNQNAVTKRLTIHANTIDHILPEKNGKQRVPLSQAVWEVEPLGNDKIKIEYNLRIDPGGGIPAWMMNMFIAKGPFESFKNLSTMIKEKRFQDQRFDFLKD